MPTFQGQVSEEQLLALTEYIKSLPAGKSALARAAADPRRRRRQMQPQHRRSPVQ